MLLNGVFMSFCLPLSWISDQGDFYALLSSAVLSANFGLIIWYLTRKSAKEVGRREGYLIVTLGWIILAITGSLPFIISGVIPSIPSAIFETISGYTTTGASILNDIESVPAGILLWRSMTQWIGGMGIIVLTVAILPMFGVGGMQMFMAEAPGPSSDKLHPKITDTAKRLWAIYVLLTGLEVICLKGAGMGWVDAVNHSFTTMSTGGFSTKNLSIAAFESPAIEYIISIFMIFGGINFSIIYFLMKGVFSKVLANEEFRVYVFMIMTFTLGIAVILFSTEGFGVEESFRKSLFQVVSIITTTGFATANYGGWATIALMLIVLLMFTGGSAGSTAGGVKIVRHIIILKNGYAEFKRLLHPRGIIPVRYNNHSVGQNIVYNILAFFFIYLFTFVIASVIISSFGYDIVTSAGAAIACLGNIGPGIGGVDPSHNFAFFSEVEQMFLGFLMLLGRLELFTVLMLFVPAFWKKM
ncbi:MAG: TrkH family potassium uptake protein [Bacteroidia bacterium]